MGDLDHPDDDPKASSLWNAIGWMNLSKAFGGKQQADKPVWTPSDTYGDQQKAIEDDKATSQSK